MKTYLDCIPCFFKQALEAARISGMDTKTQRDILNAVAKVLPEFPLEASPPEMGRVIHCLVKSYSDQPDPYRKIKDESNRFVLRNYDRLIHRLDCSQDRLLTAVELSIAGNILDYGVKNRLDVDAELEKILTGEQRAIQSQNGRFFQYEDFREALKKAKRILYLADNTGETVFDRVLLEEIKMMDSGKEMIYAVKEKPIINDALVKDAIDSGIDDVARIMSSGSDAPGTIPTLCSDSFLKIYHETDMVISKGQGNYEGLSAEKRSIFFLLLAKCPVIARDIGCRVGDLILLNHKVSKNNTSACSEVKKQDGKIMEACDR